MTTKLCHLFVIAGLTLAAPLGCKDKDADQAKVEVKVLDAAANGSPISVEFVKFTGEGEGRGMEVLLYNTGDKTAAGYFFLFRYLDAEGKVLKVKPGTPFEGETDFTSMSGGRYKCEPKQNKTLEIEGDIVAVPAEAARVEIFATQVRAIAADGNTIEDWWSQDNFNDWPS
ncbi:MAG: hypothetical protein R6X02_24280 [Enhygromyxa sp.]